MGALPRRAVPHRVTVPRGGGWSVQPRAGTAHALHEPWPAAPLRTGRVVAPCSVLAGPAIVLGSTQGPDVVDTARAAARGTDVVRRGSGGGAVVVAPGAQVWIDVWLPRDDVLWDDDVVRSSRWLGEAWARALGALGVVGLQVHTGRATRSDWGGLVCFAGLGPGEVTAHGAKLVGIAQRRVRAGARLHSLVPLTWQPSSVTALLALGPEGAGRAERELATLATGLRAVLPGPWRESTDEEIVTSVEEAFVASLP